MRGVSGTVPLPCHPSPRLPGGPAGRRRALSLRVAVLVLAVVLGVGACAGDDTDDTDDDVVEPPADTGASSPEDTGDAVAPDGEEGEGATVSVDQLAAASGGAPAATGAGLDDPPGPVERAGLPGVGEVAASITAADGTVTGCCLLVAADQAQRQQGLMGVTDLGGHQGMVFIWDDDVQSGFWMRDTPMPLSIAWFDAEGAFVSATDMDPCPATADDCPTYPPDGPYRFALEVPQGELEALGVGEGSRLALGGECADRAPA